MNKQKIIFLDCDGVLNRIFAGDMRYFHPECFHAFQTIVSNTHARIVLSTSWREFKDWENMLRDWFGAIGIKIIGKTMANQSGRTAEIRSYLEEHKNEISNYLVLDDDDMRDDFPGHCIRTCEPGRIGLDAEWAEEAIRILEDGDSCDSGEDCSEQFIIKLTRRIDGRKYYYRHDGNLTARKESSWIMDRDTAVQLASAIRKNHRDFTARSIPLSRKRK